MRNYLVTIWFNDKNGEQQLEQVFIEAPDTRYAKSNAWLSILDEYGCGCELIGSDVRKR